MDVIIYSSPDDPKKKNRGFAFLEYDSHKSASMAKHRIGNGWTRVWGCDIIVDWADPLEEPDEETMSKAISQFFESLELELTCRRCQHRSFTPHKLYILILSTIHLNGSIMRVKGRMFLCFFTSKISLILGFVKLCCDASK